MKETAEKDRNIKIMRNEGPDRLGHTILYDTLVDMASNDSTKPRVALYARVSTKNNGQDSETQLVVLREYANVRGL